MSQFGFGQFQQQYQPQYQQQYGYGQIQQPQHNIQQNQQDFQRAQQAYQQRIQAWQQQQQQQFSPFGQQPTLAQSFGQGQWQPQHPQQQNLLQFQQAQQAYQQRIQQQAQQLNQLGAGIAPFGQQQQFNAAISQGAQPGQGQFANVGQQYSQQYGMQR